MDADTVKITVRFISSGRIENLLHWLPDVAFQEDSNRKRRGNTELFSKVFAGLLLT